MRRVAAQAFTWTTMHWAMVKTFAIRGIAFYFGYRILHHEIYEIQHPEPLLIFLGLWLCGIAPATFFDGLRKIGQSTESALTHNAPHTDQTPNEEVKLDGKDNS